jgi:hypothetical protein
MFKKFEHSWKRADDDLSRLRYVEFRREAQRVRLHGDRFPGLTHEASRALVDEHEKRREEPAGRYERTPFPWGWLWWGIGVFVSIWCIFYIWLNLPTLADSLSKLG